MPQTILRKSLKNMTEEERLAHQREIKRKSRQKLREKEKLLPSPYAEGQSYTEQRQALRLRALSMVKAGVERSFILETCNVTSSTLTKWLYDENKRMNLNRVGSE